MQEVADLKPTPDPPKSPLLPWAALGTAAIFIALLLAGSNQYLTRFQKPYSFEATSEPTVCSCGLVFTSPRDWKRIAAESNEPAGNALFYNPFSNTLRWIFSLYHGC